MALIDNLISYWKLDEASGNASDSVGSNTLTNTSATYSAAVINNGAITSGSLQYFRAPTSIVTSGTVISISVWLKNGNASQAVDTTCITNQYDAGQTGVLITNQTGGSNDYSFAYGDGIIYRGITTGKFAISTSAWEHYVFIINGNNRIIYRNGSSILNDTPHANPVSFTSAGVFSLSAYPTLAIRNWNGRYDEIGVWDRELTADEVSSLYNSGIGLQYPFIGTFTAPFNKRLNSALVRASHY